MTSVITAHAGSSTELVSEITPGRTSRGVAPTHGHLHQVDLFRVLTFAAVVAVHSTAFTNPPLSTSASGVGMLLHFTREAFFFLTGFVLVYSQGDRPLRLGRFWRRRFRLIGIPYLAWTVIYVVYNQVVYGGDAAALPKTLVVDALTGRGYYHLYFLLVSMQAYLAFPVLLWLLRVTRRHPWLLLGSVAVLEVAQVSWLHHATPTTGVAGWWSEWAYALLPTYLLYLVAGAVVARHLPTLQARIVHHRTVILAGGLAAAAVTEGWYLLAVSNGTPSSDGATEASTVLQPVMVLWSCAAILLLALAACAWAARRDPGSRASTAVSWASSASFGVYLIHPLVLDGVLACGLHGPDPGLVPQPFASLLAWAVTLLGSAAIVALLRRTPLSLPLTGRARQVRARPARADSRERMPRALTRLAGSRGAVDVAHSA